MEAAPTPRGHYRDRHGRGIPGSLMAGALRSGKNKSERFSQYVNNAMEYLLGIWSEELNGVSWKVVDTPKVNDLSSEIPKWEIDRELKEIRIYRIPTERFGSHSRVSGVDERIKVEEQVFEAVAELIDVDPWDLVPDHYNS